MNINYKTQQIELYQAISILTVICEGNLIAVYEWMNKPNKNLDGAIPMALIVQNNGYKVVHLLKNIKPALSV